MPGHTPQGTSECTGLLVVMPTYNERATLPGTLHRLRRAVPLAHVLVVDDASPDGTGDWADQAAAEDGSIHVLHRTAKNGLGPAYLAGFEWGFENGFDVIVEMDADASHRPEQLPRLLDAIQDGAELAIGSRWIPGGRVHDWPLHRLLLSRGANLYVRLWLALPVHDATAGFRAYRADLLRVLMRESVASQGYCFQVDMTRRAWAAGADIREVPIDFDERTDGVSKMSSRIVREALVRVTLWGIQRRWQQLKSLLRQGRRR